MIWRARVINIEPNTLWELHWYFYLGRVLRGDCEFENCYSGHVAEIGHNSLRVNLSFVPFAAVSFFLLAIIELHNQPAGFQINSFEHDNNFCNCC